MVCAPNRMAKSKRRNEIATQTDPQGGPQTAQEGMNRQQSEDNEEQFSGQPSSTDSGRERVAQRAYELYLARGGADGQAMEDWLSAERELIEGNEDQSES
jgi:hypothetical protein